MINMCQYEAEDIDEVKGERNRYEAALHSILELGIDCDDAREGFVDAVTIAAKALGLKAAFS